MPYIYFTDEQKLRANSVDLERYLLQNGEELIRSGPEKRLKSDKSITIRGSEWFDHAQAVKTGGGPVAFVMYHYGLSYPEAMIRLLGGEQGVVYFPLLHTEWDQVQNSGRRPAWYRSVGYQAGDPPDLRPHSL